MQDKIFCFYTLTSVCVRALPFGHSWSQARVIGYCCYAPFRI